MLMIDREAIGIMCSYNLHNLFHAKKRPPLRLLV